MHDVLKRLGLTHPLILSPMGGGPGTPRLAAAVSNAGGLGSLALSYLTPDQIIEEIRQTRALTSRPISVNLFTGGFSLPSEINFAPMLEIMSEVHATLGLPAPTPPPIPRDPFPDQFAAMLECRPEAFSFTFGPLHLASISELRSRGIAIFGTATTVEEARLLADSGVEAIVAQGAEAGAHRGTFLAPVEASLIPTAQLVKQITSFAPVVAAGGIMDGRDVQTMLDQGAIAAQLGTAFLTCPESGAPDAHKQALLNATHDTTVITRAFSGRAARGLRNEFIALLEGREDSILPYPLQNALTRAMRTAAGKLGAAGYLSLWAGQSVTRSRQMPAADLMARLIEELSTPHAVAG